MIKQGTRLSWSLHDNDGRPVAVEGYVVEPGPSGIVLARGHRWRELERPRPIDSKDLDALYINSGEAIYDDPDFRCCNVYKARLRPTNHTFKDQNGHEKRLLLCPGPNGPCSVGVWEGQNGSTPADQETRNARREFFSLLTTERRKLIRTSIDRRDHVLAAHARGSLREVYPLWIGGMNRYEALALSRYIRDVKAESYIRLAPDDLLRPGDRRLSLNTNMREPIPPVDWGRTARDFLAQRSESEILRPVWDGEGSTGITVDGVQVEPGDLREAIVEANARVTDRWGSSTAIDLDQVQAEHNARSGAAWAALSQPLREFVQAVLANPDRYPSRIVEEADRVAIERWHHRSAMFEDAFNYWRPRNGYPDPPAPPTKAQKKRERERKAEQKRLDGRIVEVPENRRDILFDD